MEPERHDFLRQLEDRLSHVSGWLARRRAGGQPPGPLHTRIELLRREISRARRSTAADAHHVLERAQASLEDMERDDEASPPPHGALEHDELQALKRHLRL